MLAQNESNNFYMKIDGLPRKGEQKTPKRKDCTIVKIEEEAEIWQNKTGCK